MAVVMHYMSSSKPEWWRVVSVCLESVYESPGQPVVCPGWSLVSLGQSSIGLHPGYRGGMSK